MSGHLGFNVLITLALRQIYSWHPFLQWLPLEGQQEKAQNTVRIQSFSFKSSVMLYSGLDIKIKRAECRDSQVTNTAKCCSTLHF